MRNVKDILRRPAAYWAGIGTVDPEIRRKFLIMLFASFSTGIKPISIRDVVLGGIKRKIQ